MIILEPNTECNDTSKNSHLQPYVEEQAGYEGGLEGERSPSVEVREPEGMVVDIKARVQWRGQW